MADNLLQESIYQLQRDWDCQLFEKMESTLLEFTHLKVEMENAPPTFQNLQGARPEERAVEDRDAKGNRDS
ncbi:Hypothetical predicted protein [Podarcis lilfordi]|nr:Hypothetical predicted protein [Podarcis lilfordi]